MTEDAKPELIKPEVGKWYWVDFGSDPVRARHILTGNDGRHIMHVYGFGPNFKATAHIVAEAEDPRLWARIKRMFR
jgi:hypothetical protein